MKTKATNNLNSAQLLINNKQYTTSVHCSYYAVFQSMKYVLANTSINPIPLATQDSHMGESSHEYVLLEIKNRLQSPPRNERRFAETVRFLKKERVDADYKSREFTDEESLDCLDRAKKIVADLKTYFGDL